MRLQLALILSVICLSAYSAGMKKFDYLAGFSNVQVIGVDHRGIQIMHNTGVCHLKVEDLSDSDRALLKEEADLVAVKQKQYQERQAKLKKLKAASDKKNLAEQKKQIAAQNKEVNELVKKYASKGLFEVLKDFEAEFGLTKNARNMRLKGRVKSVVSHIERKYPLAKKSKQSFQPKDVKATKIETKPGKDKDKPVKVKKTITIAKKEPPVQMNALSKSIVLKRIALENKILNKAAAKAKAEEEKAKAKEGGAEGGAAAEESAPAESEGGAAEGASEGGAAEGASEGGSDGEGGGDEGGAE